MKNVKSQERFNSFKKLNEIKKIYKHETKDNAMCLLLNGKVVM